MRQARDTGAAGRGRWVQADPHTQKSPLQMRDPVMDKHRHRRSWTQTLRHTYKHTLPQDTDTHRDMERTKADMG